MNLTPLAFTIVDWIAFAIFLLCWMGYTRVAIIVSRRTPALSSVLHKQRERWMLNALTEVRQRQSHDILAIGMFERSVSFFASTSLIIIAGLLTVLGSSEKVADVISSLHFATEAPLIQIQFKLLLLIFLFVHAFFKFCWSMRCYSFLVTMIGAMPNVKEGQSTEGDESKDWSERAAGVLSSAAHHFNLGLRIYYFALAVLAWFISPVLFLIASVAVMAVLYRRDFKSNVLSNLSN